MPKNEEKKMWHLIGKLLKEPYLEENKKSYYYALHKLYEWHKERKEKDARTTKCTYIIMISRLQ